MGKYVYYGGAQFQQMLGQRDHEDSFAGEVILTAAAIDRDYGEFIIEDIMDGNTHTLKKFKRVADKKGFEPGLIDRHRADGGKMITHDMYGQIPLKDFKSGSGGYVSKPVTDPRRKDVEKSLNALNLDLEAVSEAVLTPEDIPALGTNKWKPYKQEWENSPTLQKEFPTEVAYRNSLVKDLEEQRKGISDITDIFAGISTTGNNIGEANSVALYYTMADLFPQVGFNGYDMKRIPDFPAQAYFYEYWVQDFVAVNGWNGWSHIIRKGVVKNAYDKGTVKRYKNKSNSRIVTGSGAKVATTIGDPIHQVLYGNPELENKWATDPDGGMTDDGTSSIPGGKLVTAGTDATITLGATATLHGLRHTSVPGRTEWFISSSPAGGSTAVPNNNKITTSFTPTVAGTYVITLKFIGDSIGEDSYTLTVLNADGTTSTNPSNSNGYTSNDPSYLGELLGKNSMLEIQVQIEYANPNIPGSQDLYGEIRVFDYGTMHSISRGSKNHQITGTLVGATTENGAVDKVPPPSGAVKPGGPYQDIVFFPISAKSVKKLKIFERERFLRESVHLSVFSVKKIKTKWYQRSAFKILLWAISFVLAIPSGGTSLGLTQLIITTAINMAIKMFIATIISMVINALIDDPFLAAAFSVALLVATGQMKVNGLGSYLSLAMEASSTYVDKMIANKMKELDEAAKKFAEEAAQVEAQMDQLIEEAGGIIRSDSTAWVMYTSTVAKTESANSSLARTTDVNNAIMTDVGPMNDVNLLLPEMIRN